MPVAFPRRFFRLVEKFAWQHQAVDDNQGHGHRAVVQHEATRMQRIVDRLRQVLGPHAVDDHRKPAGANIDRAGAGAKDPCLPRRRTAASGSHTPTRSARPRQRNTAIAASHPTDSRRVPSVRCRRTMRHFGANCNDSTQKIRSRLPNDTQKTFGILPPRVVTCLVTMTSGNASRYASPLDSF